MQTTSSINASTLIKISSGDIKLGMFMSEPDRPWLETPFLFQGLLLDNEDILQQVRKECQFIFIDKEKSSIKQEVKAQKTALPSVSTRVVNSKPMEQEFNNAFIKHQEARTEVKQVLSRMKVGEGINVTKIRSSVKTCVSSIMANPNAMLWLTKLRNRDDYIAEHCLNVGVLAIAFGKHLGLSPHELETVGLCGMLHDVGKMKIEQQLLDKPTSLTDQEFALIKEHCLLGKKILEQDSNLPDVAIEAAFSHHERSDGGGYPRGIKSESLHLYTKMISIVDTYDAITTNRCYDKSRPATEAIKILFACRNTQFDAVLVEKFIECLGIYPIGSLVELHSGEGAVVIGCNKDSRLHPRVTIVLDEHKHNRQPLIIDTVNYAESTGERTIKRVLDENDFHIDLASVYSHFRT